MTKRYGTDAAGHPLNLIGAPMREGRGSVPGLTIIRKQEETPIMAKATHDGKYTLNGARFRVRAGDPLPAGAVMDDAPEERAVKAAPENKSKPAAPETKAKANAPETKAK